MCTDTELCDKIDTLNLSINHLPAAFVEAFLLIAGAYLFVKLIWTIVKDYTMW